MTRPRALVQWVVILVCAALLTSLGGLGVLAAPLTIPALLLVGTTAPRLRRTAAWLVAGLTLVEVVWVVVASV